MTNLNYSIDDILNLMNSGKSADDIAQEFADTLNKAIKEQEKRDTERKTRDQKIASATNAVNTVFDFLTTYYSEIFPAELKEAIDIEKLIAAMDQARDEVLIIQPKLNSIFEEFERELNKTSCAPKAKESEKAVSAPTGKSDPLMDFLRKQHLV